MVVTEQMSMRHFFVLLDAKIDVDGVDLLFFFDILIFCLHIHDY